MELFLPVPIDLACTGRKAGRAKRCLNCNASTILASRQVGKRQARVNMNGEEGNLTQMKWGITK